MGNLFYLGLDNRGCRAISAANGQPSSPEAGENAVECFFSCWSTLCSGGWMMKRGGISAISEYSARKRIAGVCNRQWADMDVYWELPPRSNAICGALSCPNGRINCLGSGSWSEAWSGRPQRQRDVESALQSLRPTSVVSCLTLMTSSHVGEEGQRLPSKLIMLTDLKALHPHPLVLFR